MSPIEAINAELDRWHRLMQIQGVGKIPSWAVERIKELYALLDDLAREDP